MAFSNHSSSPDWVSQVTIKSIPTNDQLYQEFKFLDFPRPRSPDSLRLASESSSLGDRLQHHAKVYVLADRYGVERLMELSIHQLHSELLTSTSVEVMSILEWCWSQPVPEKLHNMLIDSTGNLRIFWSMEAGKVSRLGSKQWLLQASNASVGR
jgi:hypothetical protein